MIKRVKDKYTKAQVLELLDPVIKEWFETHFKDLTPPQAHAIPLIDQGRNVLVASPTGSGKTLTAFLMIINELFKLGKNSKLEDKTYCLYISPLKALANDIERNLNAPLKQIYSIAHAHGITLPEIRVGVRTGDTSINERQKMLRKPPHILITTPESLSLIISTKKFRLKLLDIQFLIVDEIHEVCNSKRGVHLSLSIERLQYQILTDGLGREFIRIGLSATQAPITEIAKFLGGYNNQNRLREINIIETPAGKELDLRVICPVQDMNLVPFEIVNAKMYNILSELIKTHRTTLIFTNTRSGTETVVYKLQEHGLDQIAAHHGSLSKETRLDVEERLKNGDLDATICSTSLELGIDIGYIDLVCQIGSPKSIAKGLQRIGRAGHALHEVSKGRIIVFDRDDLVECAVLVKNAYEGNIDRINILTNSLDVLAQTLVGMSLEKRWDVEEAYSLVKQSYCFHKLPKKDFIKVLKFISGQHSVEERGVYGKLRYHEEYDTFGIRRGARSIYNLNIGTIPQEANYKVILLDTGFPVGSLSEKFVERLSPRDVFVLGGKSYEFIKVRGMRAYVRDAHGRKPTVPSWTGEMLPRSFDLSLEVGRFRAELARRLATSTATEVENWLKNDYYLDPGSAKSILNYFIEQLGIIKALPTTNNVLIEGYIDGSGFKNVIFHYCFGRRVNDALSRAYAYALSKKLKCTVRISLTDDNFMLTLPKRIRLESIPELVNEKELRELLVGALRNTELFKQRFRHCAVRSFMILRNYKGRDISVRKQLKRSSLMLDFLHEMDNFPIISESYNEIMHDTMDIIHAEEVLNKISAGEITVSYSDYSKIPSPFAHNVVLIGVSDIILMEDRSALLRELHQQVLGKVFSKLELIKPKFEVEVVNKYFRDKFPSVVDKASLYSILKSVGPLRLFKEKGRNIYSFSSKPRDQLQAWARELSSERKIVSIIRNNEVYWVPKEDLKYYSKLYALDIPLSAQEKMVYNWLVKPGVKGRQVQARTKTQANGTSEQPISPDIEDKDLLPSIDRKELLSTIKQLEKRLLVHRMVGEGEDSVTWFVDSLSDPTKQSTREIPGEDRVDFESAIDFLILQYLKYFAPSTVSEVAYELNIDDALVQRILAELEENGQVRSGNYILGKEVPQYMQNQDLAVLDQEITPKLEVVDAKFVREYIFTKNFTHVQNIDEYFQKFGLAYGIKEMYIRTKEFDLDTWKGYLASKKVVQGRFMNGRVCYVPIDEVPIYASAYRKSELTAQEATVLQLIKRHRGITRRELSEKLDARKADLKDIIDKLERNLYIIRGPGDESVKGETDQESNNSKTSKAHGGMARRNVNRYIAYDIPKIITDCEVKIILRLLKGQGPLSGWEIKNYTGFMDNVIDDCLNYLVINGKVEKFLSVGEINNEMYILADEFEAMMKANKPSEPLNKIRILSLFDSYSIRLGTEFRAKFGEGWYTPVIYSGLPVGILDMWRLASCVEVRDITLDDELVAQALNHDRFRVHNKSISQNELQLLRDIFHELENQMEFYRLYELDILRIRGVFSKEANAFSKELLGVMENAGFQLVQKFWVKGRLSTQVFNPKQIMKFILRNQHILPKYRFTNPLIAIRTMGGMRSNYEMQLRLEGNFYEIKEFRKNFNLIAGPMIPDYYMFCTEKDLQIYKAAKGRELDFNMEYVLENMPDNISIPAKKLYDRLTLSKEQFNSIRKQLYEGLFIIRDSANRYRKVPNYPLLTKQYARKYIICRLFQNFGIFSIENLAAFTKGEFKINELRGILRELEAEGVVNKGYFIEDDDSLFWMVNDCMHKVSQDNLRFNNRFVISPNDQLATYLAPVMRKRFGVGSCYIIFHGLEITGMFRITIKRNKARVIEFEGNDEDWRTVEEFFRMNKIELFDEDAEELYTDIDNS